MAEPFLLRAFVELTLQEGLGLQDMLEEFDAIVVRVRRVDNSYEKSTITPYQLMDAVRQNYNLLLGIFNPEGWLEITYVDNEMRIGRDHKENPYILERSDET